MSILEFDGWTTIATMQRLGKSVEELARETIEDILGYIPPRNEGDGDKSGHKPARPDIQKMQDAYDLYNRAFPQGVGGPSADEIGAAYTEWQDRFSLTDRDRRILQWYSQVYRNTRSRDESFKKLALILDAFENRVEPSTEREVTELGTDSEPTPEGKRAAGALLKKYEEAHYPIEYKAIVRALNRLLHDKPSSYKLWPWAVKQMKAEFQTALDWGSVPENLSFRGAPTFEHLTDIVGEAGEVLSKLRAENRIPQNFDINHMNGEQLEEWLMEWKKENREAEAQGQVVYQFHDGWTIQKLTTADQLQFEGDEMGHCVGGYSHQVSDGSVIIYSLRDPKGMPHVTMEMHALEGAPSYGFAEGEEPPEDAIYNHEYIHPDAHAPGEHMEESVNSRVDNTTGYRPTGEKPFEVVQVQGNSNNTPKPEYQRKIKEFLDALRAKGWKFVRSEDWFAPFDDPDQGEYGDRIEEAQDLDDWYDNDYKTNHERYRGVNDNDAYGLPAERATVGIGDWEDMFSSCLGALVEEYDRGRWRGHWPSLAQAVYHAWMVDVYKDHLDEQQLERHKQNLLNEIEGAEEKLTEWDHSNEDSYYQYNNGNQEMLEKFEEILQAKGLWDQFDEKVDEAEGDDSTYAYRNRERIMEELAETEYEAEWQEAREKLFEEIQENYSGEAWKFLNYLYLLAEHNGAVNPADLPNPNEPNGGLPTHDELRDAQEKLYQRQQENQAQTPTLDLSGTSDEGLPGALSSWQPKVAMAERTGDPELDAGRVYYHISHPRHRNSILQNGLDWTKSDPEHRLPNNDDPDNHPEGWPRGQYLFHSLSDADISDEDDIWAVNGDGLNIQRDPYLGLDNDTSYVADPIPPDRLTLIKAVPWDFEKGMWIPDGQDEWHRQSATSIQIHPIDSEHDVWFDEDGNQRSRYRPGWAKNPTTGKMEQTGELEDTFLDKHGRQGQGVVAYDGDQPVGSLTWVDDQGWHMLGTAYVHPNYREQGIFNQMAAPLRETGRPIDAYVWNNPWLKSKVRSWR